MEWHPDLMHQVARLRCDERRARSLTAFAPRGGGTRRVGRRGRREHGLLLTLACAVVSRGSADVRPAR